MASIAVVIPCYNYGRFLGEALNAVLAQTLSPSEILVVDDGSTDETPDVCRRYPEVRYLWKPNGGLSSARNHGIRNSRADCLVFPDADDILHPHALMTLWNGWEDVKSVAGAVFARGRLVYEREPLGGEQRGELPSHGAVVPHFLRQAGQGTMILSPTIVGVLLRGNIIHPNCAMISRATFDHCGLWDESIRTIEDREFWLRVASQCPLAYVNRVVADVRKHGTNITSPANWVKNRLNILQVLERASTASWASPDLRKAAARRYSTTSYLLGQRYASEDDFVRASQMMIGSLAKRPFGVKPWVRLLEYRLRGLLSRKRVDADKG